MIEKKGRAAIEVIGEIVPEVVQQLPVAEVDALGRGVGEAGALSWVRPLHSIIATFGPETEEPDVVPFTVDGIASGDTTRGHRFLAPAPIKVRRFDDYVAKLEKAKVVLDPERRRQSILADAKNLAFAQGFELVEDEGLLDEVAGLVEWPVVLMGSFDEAFLAIPEEVIRATIRNNQKCFVLRDPQERQARQPLHPRLEHRGQGRRQGDRRRQRARHPRAAERREVLLRDRSEGEARRPAAEVRAASCSTRSSARRRSASSASSGWRRELAPLVRRRCRRRRSARRSSPRPICSPTWSASSPKLQGLMGHYYAQAQGEDEAVARAIEEHYKPLGPTDRVPTDPVSIAVALADKLDMLVGFWAIDEKPTGSKDPYALRRAALGRDPHHLGQRAALNLALQFRDSIATFDARHELAEPAEAGDGSTVK